MFRHGFAPFLTDRHLGVLGDALDRDDHRLIQGRTTSPPPLQCLQDWPVEGACAIGFCGWQGDGLKTVAEVEEFFAGVCAAADDRLGESGIVRLFLNWFDDADREEARWSLFEEVCDEEERRLARRRNSQC